MELGVNLHRKLIASAACDRSLSRSRSRCYAWWLLVGLGKISGIIYIIAKLIILLMLPTIGASICMLKHFKIFLQVIWTLCKWHTLFPAQVDNKGSKWKRKTSVSHQSPENIYFSYLLLYYSSILAAITVWFSCRTWESWVLAPTAQFASGISMASAKRY